MKSLTNSSRRAIPDSQFQISLPMQGVLRDVQHAGGQVLAAMMEADRAALCGPKGVPETARRAVRGGSTPARLCLCWAASASICAGRACGRSMPGGAAGRPTWASRAAG